MAKKIYKEYEKLCPHGIPVRNPSVCYLGCPRDIEKPSKYHTVQTIKLELFPTLSEDELKELVKLSKILQRLGVKKIKLRKNKK